ncbi:hypothetical protein SO802_006468 [Lithocarpus litseifolius]|uniref:Uncharacterized protein n=1 Tax=Lithocarpus litseifolius TaxID=425828 RepID=A0AAW2DPX3_9ROSI
MLRRQCGWDSVQVGELRERMEREVVRARRRRAFVLQDSRSGQDLGESGERERSQSDRRGLDQLGSSPSTTMSPSMCSSSIDNTVSSTQNRLYQARLILQYQELNDHYDLCRARLINLLSEAQSLRHENVELRLPNAELLKLLSSQASFHNLLLSSSFVEIHQQI